MMNARILRSVSMLCVLFFTATAGNAQAPVFTSVTPNATSIGRYEKFELGIKLTAGYTNPYDYDDIAVQAIFVAPSGAKDTVDGFYMKTYAIGGSGYIGSPLDSMFAVRYTPREVGSYSYTVSCKNVVGSAAAPAGTFQSVSSDNKGFIRRNTTNYLSFDNGNQYIPVGENIGWQSGSVVADYTKWAGNLANNGGNFLRVWMSSWAFGIEWKNVYNGDEYQGLKRYKQSSAYYLDWLLDYCKQKGLYMMLTLNNHGQVSTQTNPEWSNNPYNAANGGPAANTWDFFTNTTAKTTIKNRFRYIVARYGYSQNIQSWELFNELLWTDQAAARKSDLTAWDNEMSTYIKSKDVNKHLVTTSYGADDFTTDTWKLPNIDFSQTHFYVGAPNIESIMSSANQAYLSEYNKPTLNGEFGLAGDGSTLTTDDPNGVYIHNAIWGTTFSGAMGSAMTWWWDNYMEPNNLYYHFKPLSSFVNGIDLKDGNYKKVNTSSTGGGGADVSISPGYGYGLAPAGNFTIDASGNVSPGSNSLSQFLFGSTYNTQNRNPPTFRVTYPTAGQFKVNTSGSMSTSSPRITIYLDGVQVLNNSATANTTYTVSVPAGTHDIKVDNLGIDWAGISTYVFTGIGRPVTTYALKSQDSLKVAGYMLNNQYNWQYLKSSGTAPAAINGVTLNVPAMKNGSYKVELYSCSTGGVLSTTTVQVTNGTLAIPMPSIAWDIAFKASEASTLPLTSFTFKGQQLNGKNKLLINIAAAENVQTVILERSADGVNYASLNVVSGPASTLSGSFDYIDNAPFAGQNYYRLHITDKDGRQTYSPVVRLQSDKDLFVVYPNPIKDVVMVRTGQKAVRYAINDQSGRVVIRGEGGTDGMQDIRINVSRLVRGIYYLTVFDTNGNKIGYKKLVK